MWPYHVGVGAGEGADDDQGQTAGVEGVAGWDNGREGAEDGLGGVKGLGRVTEEVLACGENEVIGDKGLEEMLACWLYQFRDNVTHLLVNHALAQKLGQVIHQGRT